MHQWRPRNGIRCRTPRSFMFRNCRCAPRLGASPMAMQARMLRETLTAVRYHVIGAETRITSLCCIRASTRACHTGSKDAPTNRPGETMRIRQVRQHLLGTTWSLFENDDGRLIPRGRSAVLAERRREAQDRQVSDGATSTAFPMLARNLGSLSPALVRHLDSLVIHFLPKNYRSSVPPAYFTYSKWYAVGAIANSASLVLSTQSMLYAVGLGAGAIPVAAALNWVLKDGLGQLGGILFTSYVNNRFDADPKRWRMVAALILDLSSFLEAATPLFPALFLPFAALGNAGKNISWLAASATRAGIHMSFARRSNLADLTGKAGSQGVVCSLLGTTLGISASPLLGSSPLYIIPALACLSVVHLACMLQALRSVSLPTLNAQALDAVAARFIASGGASLPTPEDVGRSEVVLGHFGSHLALGYKARQHPAILIGPDAPRMAEALGGAGALVQSLRGERFAVAVLDKGAGPVGLLLAEDATARDTLLGYLEAALLRSGNGSGEARAFREEHGEELVRGLQDGGWNTMDVFAEEFRARVDVLEAQSATDEHKSRG